jgi:ABC-type multidrug transport system fused ATPase/permease subunit
MSLASEVWSILTPSQRRQVLAAQIIALAMAFSTVTGIAAIAPFFAVLGEPRLIEQNMLLHWLYLHGGFSSQRGFIVLLGAAFVSFVLIANLINALGTLAMNRLALRVGNQLQTAMFADYLSRPYSFHAGTNSATLVKNIVYESTRVTNGILLNGLILVANLVTASFIVLAIVLLNPTVAIAMIAGLAGGYALIYLAVRNRVLRSGRAQSLFAAEQTQIVNESFGAIRELIVLQVQSFFSARFERVSSALALAAAHCQVVAQSPRHLMECVAAAVLVGIALVLGGRQDGVGPWLGQLTFLAFAAYRLLPILQQIFATVVKIRADFPAFALIAPDLRHARAARPTMTSLDLRRSDGVSRTASRGNPAGRCVVPLCGRPAVGPQGRVAEHCASIDGRHRGRKRLGKDHARGPDRRAAGAGGGVRRSRWERAR